jgi:hypothetical protein
MANGHGGSRTPSNPAPVSGPGAMSQRTDGGPTQSARYMAGGDYGDGEAMMDLQRSAPMAASPAPQTQAQSASGGQPRAVPTPIHAPTERPNEPVTAGNPGGPGPGPGVLSVPDQPYLSSVLQRMADADNSGDAAFMLSLAQRLGY